MSDVSHLSSSAGQTARREIALLPELLESGENVVDLCHGTIEGGRTAVIVLTDRRVVYLQRRRLWGARVETVALENVKSAEDQIGVRHATASVDAGGRVFELADVDRSLARVFCARLRAQLRAA
jgi:hypothetical protein